jgi:hypothetical protein
VRAGDVFAKRTQSSLQITLVRVQSQSEEAAAGIEIFGPVASPTGLWQTNALSGISRNVVATLESAGAGAKTSPSATSPAMVQELMGLSLPRGGSQ